jgi:hypothetical protein
MSSKPFFVLSFLVLAASITAQNPVAARLSTAADLGVFANQQQNSVPNGTAAPVRLAVADGRSALSHSSAALRDPTRSTGADFGWDSQAAAGNSAGTLGDSGGGLAVGPQRYDLVLVAARTSVTGSLVISFDGRAINATAGAAVSVGREVRRFDASNGAGRASIDGLTVGSQGLAASVEISGLSGDRTLDSGYGCGLSVVFVVDGGGGGGTCTITPHTSSCSKGGTLDGRATSTGRGFDLGLNLTGALPDAIGVSLASVLPDTFPIGRTGCVFFRDAIVIGAFQTDGRGNAATMYRIPAVRGSMYLQQGTFAVSPTGVAIGTSNTLQVVCN